MRKPILHLVFSLLFFSFARAQKTSSRDALFTRDGEEIRGELKEIDDATVRFDAMETELEIPKGEVVRIELGGKRAGDWWTSVEDIDDTVLSNALAKMPSPEEFANAGYLLLHGSDIFTIHADGSTEHYSRRIALLLSERRKDRIALEEVYYFPDAERAEIVHARSVSPDGKITHLDESALERGPVNSFIPAYDRLWLLKCALGEVVVGSVVDIAFVENSRWDEPFDPFAEIVFFRDEEPCVFRELVIEAEAGTPISFIEINWRNDWRKASLEDFEMFTRISWRIENIPAMVAEPDMPPPARFLPAIFLAANPPLADVRNSFLSAIELNESASARIEELSRVLTGGSRSDVEKARKIYNWVVENIRYVPITTEDFGFEPRQIADVLNSRLANELDRVILFYSIAKSARLDVAVAFAGTHDLPFSREVQTSRSTPIPVVRCSFEETLWCAFSDEYMPMGVVPAEIMGENAVVFGEEKLEFTRIPLPNPDEEGVKEVVSAKLDKNGKLKIEWTKSFFGTHREKVGHLKRASAEERELWAEALAASFHPNASLKKWRFSGIENLDEIPEIHLELEIEDYATDAGGKLLAFYLPFSTKYARSAATTERSLPLWFDSPQHETSRMEISLPRGFDIYYIPPDTAIFADSIGYNATFSLEKRRLIFTDDFFRARLSFPRGEYPIYRDCIRTRSHIAETPIILEKK